MHMPPNRTDPVFEEFEDEYLAMCEGGESLMKCSYHAHRELQKRGINMRWGSVKVALYRWVRKDEDRQRRFDEARQIGAVSGVDDLTYQLEELTRKFDDPHEEPPSREQINVIKMSMQHKHWMATKLVPQFNDRGPEINLNLSVGDLHLEGLKQYGHIAPGTEPKKIAGETETVNTIPEAEYAEVQD